MNAKERLVEAYEKGYRVDPTGKPIGLRGQLIVAHADKDGYLRFTIKFSDGKCCGILVHRLAAYQKFKDELFRPGIEVRHLNGNKIDNSENNVAIGSHSQNEMDKDPVKRTEASRRAARKLSDEQVAQLRTDRVNGMTYNQLVEKYDTCKSNVSYIVRGLTCK